MRHPLHPTFRIPAAFVALRDLHYGRAVPAPELNLDDRDLHVERATLWLDRH